MDGSISGPINEPTVEDIMYRRDLTDKCLRLSFHSEISVSDAGPIRELQGAMSDEVSNNLINS